MRNQLDWWAESLRDYLSVAEMLTAKPRDDWPVRFFSTRAEDRQRKRPDGTIEHYFEYVAVRREPKEPWELSLAIYKINDRLGMVQGKKFMTGRGPDVLPNNTDRNHRLKLSDVSVEKLHELVRMCDETIRATGYDLDTGDAVFYEDAWRDNAPPPSPQVAFNQGFCWIALTELDWIKPPDGRLRMAQLEGIREHLGLSPVVY